MSLQIAPVVFSGGLDLMTPYLQIPPGRMIIGLNYEEAELGGYRRIAGYALFDGSDTPAAVPGTGPIRGVWALSGLVVAVRDVDGSTAAMYMASSSGWQLVDLGTRLSYDAGTLSELKAGDAITGGTSGATATVVRNSIRSGLIGNSDVAGTLTLESVTGTFADDENLLLGVDVVGVADGASTANTLTAGGRYEWVNANFFGQADTRAIYGVNGLDMPFEFDGTTFSVIDTGISAQQPTHITEHQNRLVFGYQGGSIQLSGAGEPFDYRQIKDAFEVAIGDRVNGFIPMPGGVLGVAARNSFAILYGRDTSNFELRRFSSFGIQAYSFSEVNKTIFAVDERGVTVLQPSDAFGDFNGVVVSDQIKPELTINNRIRTVTASMTARVKGQYRVFFGSTGYYFTMRAGAIAGIGKVSFNHPVLVACGEDDESDGELLLFGSDDGQVFQMDQSDRFNGEPILAFIRTPFLFFGQPTARKQLRRIFLDARSSSEDPLPVFARVDFDNAGADVPSSRVAENEIPASFEQAIFDADLWDQGRFSVAFRAQVPLDVRGYGENMSLTLLTTGETPGTHTFFGAIYHYSQRRPLR